MKIKINNSNERNHLNNSLPQHMQNQILTLTPDETDFNALTQLFEDAETVSAVWKIIESSPPEIKILFFLQLRNWQEYHSSNDSEVF